jgi:HEAT repeat protein
MKFTREFLKSLPTHNVINLAILNPHDDDVDSPYWDCVSELRDRGNSEAYAAACSLCRSDCPIEQRIGSDILAQFGEPKSDYVATSFPLVVSVLRRTDDLWTLQSAISALGWFGDLRGVDFVLPYVEHVDADVRDSVVHALTHLNADSRSIDSLIRLSVDSSDQTRDWATFGLGRMCDQDTPAIRHALLARLDDVDETTRCEALVGLALRKDERVIDALIRELTRDEVHEYAIEAAAILGDPNCLPMLERLRDANPDAEGIREAIEKCRASYH